MAEAGASRRSAGGFVVLREAGDSAWELIGEADRRPGLRDDAARARAVRDVTGGLGDAGQVYAVVLRSEWRVARRL